MKITKLVKLEKSEKFVLLDVTFKKKNLFRTKTFTKTCVFDFKWNYLKFCDDNKTVNIDISWYIPSVWQFIESDKNEITFK